ncbi:hypothetical protein B0H14DRAFT_3718567 [Mycena olivaceomarginata]|nr:hypothetical protein B0H14DRAFT_3718567 [Mycena olivaceomarginata]
MWFSRGRHWTCITDLWVDIPLSAGPVNLFVDANSLFPVYKLLYTRSSGIGFVREFLRRKRVLDWGCEKVTGVKATPVRVACKGFELLALGGGRQTQDVMDSSYLSYKHKSFTDSGCLYFLGTGGGLLEKQAQELHELHVLRLLVLYWTADYWKNKHRSFTYSGYLFFTGRRITGKQAQELHVLRLLVLLLDGGLLNGGLTAADLREHKMGAKLLPAYAFKLFRGQDFSMIPTEYYSGPVGLTTALVCTALLVDIWTLLRQEACTEVLEMTSQEIGRLPEVDVKFRWFRPEFVSLFLGIKAIKVPDTCRSPNHIRMVWEEVGLAYSGADPCSLAAPITVSQNDISLDLDSSMDFNATGNSSAAIDIKSPSKCCSSNAGNPSIICPHRMRRGWNFQCIAETDYILGTDHILDPQCSSIVRVSPVGGIADMQPYAGHRRHVIRSSKKAGRSYRALRN